MNWNFPELPYGKLILNHFNTLLRSHLRLLEDTFSGLFLQLYSALSSVKLQTSEKNNLLINILKSRDPGTEPCGTPVLSSYHEIKAKPILVLCLRLVR